jgi:hypothetical protein
MTDAQVPAETSDAPRTDAVAFNITNGRAHREAVFADFARTLERELAAMTTLSRGAVAEATELRASLRREENARLIAVKDADRYRWLRHQRRWYATSPPVPGIAFKFENFIADNGETLDAAIDAAMGKQS